MNASPQPTLAKPLRLGIIGCGNVLEAYVPQCDRLRAKGLAELAIACGRPHQKARARSLGVPRFTTSETKVLEQSDLVIVLTSMPEHARLATAALKAGKHVLVEKPLATSLPEARDILALARSTPGYLLCAPFTTLSPTFRTIASRIQTGVIGTPSLARGRYGWSGPWWSDWFYKTGGGPLFDLGVYPITTLTGLLGPVRRVVALGGISQPQREVNGRTISVETEDHMQILLEFQNNSRGVVTTGFTMQQYRCPSIEVYGSTGSIQMLGDDWDPDGYELWQNSAGCWQVFKETHPDWNWTDGINHLVECIHQNRKPDLAPEHAVHVLEIMLKATESVRTGQAQALETSFQPQSFTPQSSGADAHLAHDRSREHVL